MSANMLEDICDRSQSCPITNRREARYKICDHFKQSQEEWKGDLLSTQNMVKVLHKVSNYVVNEISQALPILIESVSEVSYFIPKPINFPEVTSLLDFRLWVYSFYIPQGYYINLFSYHVVFVCRVVC